MGIARGGSEIREVKGVKEKKGKRGDVTFGGLVGVGLKAKGKGKAHNLGKLLNEPCSKHLMIGGLGTMRAGKGISRQLLYLLKSRKSPSSVN